MNQEQAITNLQETFREFFGDDGIQLTAATTADDVEGWDSLANVELMVELEERFSVRFRTGEVADLPNVGALADLIVSRVTGD